MLKPQNTSSAPFVIAVTGHRDLRPQDLDALRHEVRAVLDGLRSHMPGATLLLLSGLAEGADQLVAEVALERGVLLTAVLPMPLEVYRIQMKEEAQQKLDKLIGLSAEIITLAPEHWTPEQIQTSKDAQAACYETLARFLVWHCQALIALWDGMQSDKPGGTCRVVRYARAGTSPGSAEQVDSRCAVVYHVLTPRTSVQGTSDEVKTVTLTCGPRRVAASQGTRD